jgi:hypothetical protein
VLQLKEEEPELLAALVRGCDTGAMVVNLGAMVVNLGALG